MHPMFRSLCIASVLAAGIPCAQAQVAAITLTQPGDAFESAPYSLGFAFSVLQDLRLTALGVYDHGADGLEGTGAQVALWLDGQPQALRVASVPGGTAATLDGLFRHAPVQPLDLHPGAVYVVAAYLDGGMATSFGVDQGGAAVVDARISLLADRYADGFFELAYPGQSDAYTGAWLGANLLLAPVPEPAPAALLAAGLVALAWRGRRAARRSA